MGITMIYYNIDWYSINNYIILQGGHAYEW